MSSDPENLRTLLEKVANADQSAFSEVYELMSARLLGIQLRILKNRELAEDALQETFVKVWNSASQFDGSKANAVVWLNSLARNQAIDHLRRMRTRANVSVDLKGQSEDEWPDNNYSPIEQLADEQRLSLCLDRLDPVAQQCIVGLYCDGFTQDELSKQLNHPIGTIKSWIRRGLIKLKECLHELS